MIPNRADIPKASGAYALQLYLDKQQQITIGRLGKNTFQPGNYIYLGSAHGPGGLRARLGRHLDGKTDNSPHHQTHLHWHIDYLRQATQALAGCYLLLESIAPEVAPIECLWSQALAQLPDIEIPLSGFGASDCRSSCRSHLVMQPGAANSALLADSTISQVLAEVAGAQQSALRYILLSS